MKEHFKKYALIGVIIILFSLSYIFNNRIKALENSRYMAVAGIVNMFNDASVIYLFQEVKDNPTVQNLEVLSYELLYRKKVIEAIIVLYENRITKLGWDKFNQLPNEQASMYFLNFAQNNKVDEIDKDTIERIESAWLRFHKFIRKDMQISVHIVKTKIFTFK